MPDSKTVSSILVNEVLATAADQLHREKDYISDDIAQNEDETAKLRKIIAKYQDALARQQKEEKNAMDDLMLQQEELKDLHQHSKELADELAGDRELLLKLKVENKKKLASLNEYDLLGDDIMGQVEAAKLRINEKEAAVKELDDVIAELDHNVGQVSTKPMPVQKVRTYKVAKGDEVDEMLAQYINGMRIELPISRLGGGQYMFGSKKIYAKVMNSKLVVRVGGGYMDMNEFITTYAESERLKLQHMDPAEVDRLHANN